MTEETQSGAVREDCFGYARDKRGIVSDNARDKQRCRALKDFYNGNDCAGCTFYKTSVRYAEDQNKARARLARLGLKTQEDYTAAYKNMRREIAEENRAKKKRKAETRNAEPAVIENTENEQETDLGNVRNAAEWAVTSGKRKRLTTPFLKKRAGELKAAGRFFENAGDIPSMEELTALRVWMKLVTEQRDKIAGAERNTYYGVVRARHISVLDRPALTAAFGDIRSRAERLFEMIPRGDADYAERRAVLELYYFKSTAMSEIGELIGMKRPEVHKYITKTAEKLSEEARTNVQ